MRLIQELASDPQAVRWVAEATTGKLVDQEARSSELVLKVQSLAEEAGRADDLQKCLDRKVGRLE